MNVQIYRRQNIYFTDLHIPCKSCSKTADSAFKIFNVFVGIFLDKVRPPGGLRRLKEICAWFKSLEFTSMTKFKKAIKKKITKNQNFRWCTLAYFLFTTSRVNLLQFNLFECHCALLVICLRHFYMKSVLFSVCQPKCPNDVWPERCLILHPPFSFYSCFD